MVRDVRRKGGGGGGAGRIGAAGQTEEDGSRAVGRVAADKFERVPMQHVW